VLEKLTITGGVCFGEEPVELTTLKPVNFFFGPNGSGKTTISRALAGDESLVTVPTWIGGSPATIQVYNRDFVERTLRESSRIPGVFVLGERSVASEQRLESIEREGGERAQALDSFGRAKASRADAETADSSAKDTFRDTAWSTYKTFIEANPALNPAFIGTGGIGGSKQKLVDRLLTHVAGEDSVPTIESMTESAAAVFATDASTCVELPKVLQFDGQSLDGYALFPQRVVGSDTVTLSELVERLGNSDWVEQGAHYMADADGVCPFCQQAAPVELVSDLASMFDEHYKSQREQLDAVHASFTTWRSMFDVHTSGFDLASKNHLDDTHYATALAAAAEAATRVGVAIDKKRRTPAEIVEFPELEGLIDAVNAVIEEANVKIRSHNALVTDRRQARPVLVARSWRYLAEGLLKDVLSVFKSKQLGRDRGSLALATLVEVASAKISALDEEVRGLQRSVESTKPVIEQINGILHRSGFTSFEIVESPSLEDGYMLARDGGAIQEHSLSEGERTFIAFLYYFHLLDGRSDETDALHHVVAVVDDPISSLDSDVLYVVSALMRNLVERALSGENHVTQLIVLTHNVYFHKEITYIRDGEKGQGRTYFLIRKRPSMPSTIEARRTNPVSTEYRRLWDEVKRAIDGEVVNIVGLENILRRILESYFRVMGGGIWDHEITPHLTTSERHVFRALFNWVNEGSHAVLEDIFYTPSAISQDVYLQVFKRVFVVTGHESHYQMMILGKASLTTPPESADQTEEQPAA